MAQASTFSKIRISLASPDEMRKWSHGEVKKPETINYRTLKPERDGLFCERIFGPVKDWECHCGRYKKVKYKGIVCERCGVEVTRSKVRRERMGHIELAAPVTHIWYLKGVPSPMSLLLDISPKLLEKVVYFGSYIVTHVDRLRLNEELPAIQQAVEEQIQEMERTGIEDPTLLAPLPEPEEILEAIEVPEVVLPLEEVEGTPLVPEEEIEQEPLVETEAPEVALEEGIEPEVTDEEEIFDEELLFEKSAILEPTRLEGKNLEDRIAELRAAVDRLQVIQKRELIAEDEWRNIQRVLEIASIRLNKDYTHLVKAGLGAAAIRDLLAEIDLEELARELRTEIAQTQGPRRARAIKRLEVVDAFLKSKSRPEWMILEVITVIPPDLRPMVQLDGGRFATSDLNDLYRRIINRNNRLKKIIEIRAPESIINHEKRLLQEAVDALIDNSRRSRPVVGSNNRPLRSLSDMLKGKEGRFRKNLLGKRVDYSGRSVIVVGPHLKLHQCGLPKEMALELFKPFVMKKLVEKGVASTVKAAKRKMERAHREPAIWDALAEVIQDHPVLLNRAPTLHRLGIQAFEPILVDGKAIQLHPLVCVAFGADFDGDQMAVHVPLSATAQAEARLLMLSILNLFKPAFGEPISAPKQDMVLGLYYLTMMDQKGGKGAGLVFKDAGEAIRAYQAGYVSLHAPVKIRMRTEGGGYTYVETTVGRAILNQLLPEESTDGKPTIWVERTAERFINKTMDSQAVADLVAQWYNEKGWQATVKLLDGLKDLGFQFATQSGISIAITDMEVPKERDLIIEETQKRVDQLNRAYQRGLITQGEREQQVLRSWTEAFDRVADAILRNVDQFNPVYMMTDSGARGSRKQVTQLSGMRGVMSDPFGRMIEDLPIKSNFHEGLSVLEYFISTHGQRKGLADTALRTADAGYLTRRLVDVAQDVIIREWDCGTTQGIYVSEIREPGEEEPIESLADRIRGRIALEDIYLPGESEPIVRANEEISDEAALKIQEAGITRVGIRSPMTCEARRGICAMCYGRDVGRQKMAQVGMAVGIIAAQSIGEPGTQLTMRTFHTGGVAAQHITGVAGVKRKKQETLKELHEDARRGLLSLGEGGERERSKAIQAMLKVLEEEVRGLLRVVELVEARRPKGQAIITEYDGVVAEIVEQRGLPEVVIHSELPLDDPERLMGERLAEDIRQPDTPEGEEGEVLVPAGTEINERVLRILQDLGYTRVKIRRSYLVPHRGAQRDPQTGKFISAGRVHVGQKLQAGDRLTEGPLDPQKILELQGVRGVQDYLVSEIQQVYKGQSVDINDKHIEIIVRQMLKKVKVIEPGDTDFLPGQIVDRFEFRDQNQRVEAQGGRPATAEPLLLGITEASLSTDSFLSAASFQKTTKVLADAAIRGKEDQLIGLKENVIIGRLIPAGTGLSTYRQQQRARQNGEEARKARVAD